MEVRRRFNKRLHRKSRFDSRVVKVREAIVLLDIWTCY